MTEAIPHFRYKPTCTDIICLAQKLEEGGLEIEQEIAELVSLRYVQNIQTISLIQSIQSLHVPDSIKDEISDLMMIVSISDVPQATKLSIQPRVFSEQQLKSYLKLIQSLKKQYASITN